MAGKELVEKLLKAQLHLQEEDEVYVRNVLLSQFGYETPNECTASVSAATEAEVPDALVEELKAFAVGRGLCTEEFAERYSANVFGLLTPLPSEINRAFWQIKETKGARRHAIIYTKSRSGTGMCRRQRSRGI